MPKKRKKIKRRTNPIGDDRIIDLMERLGTVGLYLTGDLDQNTIARKLGMDTNRVNEILKGLKKK